MIIATVGFIIYLIGVINLLIDEFKEHILWGFWASSPKSPISSSPSSTSTNARRAWA